MGKQRRGITFRTEMAEYELNLYIVFCGAETELPFEGLNEVVLGKDQRLRNMNPRIP